MHTAREPMTHRPDVDQPQLDHMLRQAAAAVACPGCPAKTRRTTRRAADDTVRFDITATWRSDAVIARLAAPLARVLQRQATQRYLNAMTQAIS